MLFTVGDVVVDTAARQLRRGRDEVRLSPKAFDLLDILIAERPRAVRKQELYDRLWPETFVVEANLPILVAEVRAALGDTSHTIIRTVQRYGYAFAADLPAEGALHILIHGEERFRLGSGENVAGREPGAAVLIASASVSRRHAIITISGDEATLTDLGSKNGTWIDGRRVAGPVQLADGSVIRFGGVEMTYRRSDAVMETATLTR
jgi:DNA-binding winged helix-turn-helix (wHTH) protein